MMDFKWLREEVTRVLEHVLIDVLKDSFISIKVAETVDDLRPKAHVLCALLNQEKITMNCLH